ncbi:MAG: molybdenum cofactor biosynthesis protein [Candidatus Tectimicrobiota bacterium]|nr:MAG: molybdenum cofactor biosynthesis protein [Candidatus Tectomicrobia bacterium]
MAKTAAIVVIGNEILSGKVTDTNSPFLCRELRALGVDVRRIVVVPDDLAAIAEEVAACARTYDYVFTTGGVGPTHDDVTIAAVAHGLQRPLVVHPELQALFETHWADRPETLRRKMASVPAGTQLLLEPSLPIPVLQVDNVYIFPGIPQLLQRKFAAIKERFRESPYWGREVYVTVPESSIAHLLEALLAEFPELQLGSYPQLGHPDYRVKLTLESKDPDYVARACARLLALLPPSCVARVE